MCTGIIVMSGSNSGDFITKPNYLFFFFSRIISFFTIILSIYRCKSKCDTYLPVLRHTLFQTQWDIRNQQNQQIWNYLLK